MLLLLLLLQRRYTLLHKYNIIKRHSQKMWKFLSSDDSEVNKKIIARTIVCTVDCTDYRVHSTYYKVQHLQNSLTLRISMQYVSSIIIYTISSRITFERQSNCAISECLAVVTYEFSHTYLHMCMCTVFSEAINDSQIFTGSSAIQSFHAKPLKSCVVASSYEQCITVS